MGNSRLLGSKRTVLSLGLYVRSVGSFLDGRKRFRNDTESAEHG